jgi:hypothetical protein
MPQVIEPSFARQVRQAEANEAIRKNGSGIWTVYVPLVATNNLSDLSNVATALTNLGISAFIQTLLNDVDAATARSTLGLGTIATLDAADFVDLTSTQIITGFKTFTANTSAAKALLVKGAASQTAALFEVQDSSANVLAQMNPRVSTTDAKLLVLNPTKQLITDDIFTLYGYSSSAFAIRPSHFDGGTNSRTSPAFRIAGAHGTAVETFAQFVMTPNGEGTGYLDFQIGQMGGSGTTQGGFRLFKTDNRPVLLKVSNDATAPVGQMQVDASWEGNRVAVFQGYTSQTAVIVQLRGVSSVQAREQVDLDTAWVDSTDATRKARSIFRVWDTAAREFMRADATGSAAKVGFFGAVDASYDLAVNGTARVTGKTQFDQVAYSPSQTLTDGANIAWDVTAKPVATVTLEGNRTLDNPTNMVAGGTFLLAITQDGVGGRTLAFGTAYKWPGGVVPTLSTGAGEKDLISFYCHGGTEMWGVIQKDFS